MESINLAIAILNQSLTLSKKLPQSKLNMKTVMMLTAPSAVEERMETTLKTLALTVLCPLVLKMKRLLEIL